MIRIGFGGSLPYSIASNHPSRGLHERVWNILRSMRAHRGGSRPTCAVRVAADIDNLSVPFGDGVPVSQKTAKKLALRGGHLLPCASATWRHANFPDGLRCHVCEGAGSCLRCQDDGLSDHGKFTAQIMRRTGWTNTQAEVIASAFDADGGTLIPLGSWITTGRIVWAPRYDRWIPHTAIAAALATLRVTMLSRIRHLTAEECARAEPVLVTRAGYDVETAQMLVETLLRMQLLRPADTHADRVYARYGISPDAVGATVRPSGQSLRAAEFDRQPRRVQLDP